MILNLNKRRRLRHTMIDFLLIIAAKTFMTNIVLTESYCKISDINLDDARVGY
jgi:hypothetical protein